ncbi:hypothetical protein [Natronincola ferrireducens]|uniref:Uncharacterized protein n=1 Tax=Natronincola ferrireducens TaxID=393762 RepID=A0A1G9BES2_9FIRM|nr:hypothetical protein [Natronincola ferrireducens]SDK38056.1 hypothetical protein SAMN05660472_01155 [Natronincola ferrireducens]
MESILIFIVFVIISSVFNKDKRAKKTSRRPRGLDENEMDRGQDHSFDKPKPTVTRREGGFGDLIQELRADFNEVFKEKSITREVREDNPKPIEETTKDLSYNEKYEYEYGNEYQKHINDKELEIRYDVDKKKAKERSTPIKPVYTNETQQSISNNNLSFDEQTLLQGIIMSEILGKPKALKK